MAVVLMLSRRQRQHEDPRPPRPSSNTVSPNGPAILNELVAQHHSGVGLHTPASVHYGTAPAIRALRSKTLDAAYAANPARFRHRRPSPPKLPTVAWINKPTIGNDAQKKS